MAKAPKPIGPPAVCRRSWDRRVNSTSSFLRCAGALLLLFVVCGILETMCRAEDQSRVKPLFLVARPTILDPFFQQSVVLMIPLHEEQIVVGLIINKPTRLSLSKAFPKIPALKDRSDPVYMGGPVEMSTPALIFHAAKIPKQAIPLYDDVYLSFDPKLISKFLEDPKPMGDSRLFMGRAQWAPEQLDGEALEGSWYSLHAEGELIFDRDTEHLWKRLHDRARPASSVEYRMPRIWRQQPGLVESNFLLPGAPIVGLVRAEQRHGKVVVGSSNWN